MTSTPKGFFVNRCTRSVFDPRPAPNPHFSHELFNTLLDMSTSLRVSWQNLCVNASEAVGEGEGEGEGGGGGGGGDEDNNEYNGDASNSGALDVLTALCSQVSAVQCSAHLHVFSSLPFTSLHAYLLHFTALYFTLFPYLHFSFPNSLYFPFLYLIALHFTFPFFSINLRNLITFATTLLHPSTYPITYCHCQLLLFVHIVVCASSLFSSSPYKQLLSLRTYVSTYVLSHDN